MGSVGSYRIAPIADLFSRSAFFFSIEEKQKKIPSVSSRRTADGRRRPSAGARRLYSLKISVFYLVNLGSRQRQCFRGRKQSGFLHTSPNEPPPITPKEATATLEGFPEGRAAPSGLQLEQAGACFARFRESMEQKVCPHGYVMLSVRRKRQ